ncbi:MAG: RdgB/HAM1 family non-canonical purine NTP pyrophosphatase [Chitinophagales bacterium]|nr:RdgB/HAM1 family non-canonical purine NTP pyrophosphatase [Chitinophagales bacterium]MDW8428299.1 RdgB/HAM1 family non-canonical purine NTP pyrophosphatase [Chitinophagales bacterium]
MSQASPGTLSLVFASFNKHKLLEYQAMAPFWLKLQGLKDLHFDHVLPEPYQTLEGNACAKARYVAQLLQVDCFADDSGLEVEALNGAPGWRSAHYAGPNATDMENIEQLLASLQHCSHRRARFRAVICLIVQNREHLFEGILNGTIAHHPRGQQGFGYDPIFVPEGYTTTLAQLTLEQKNSISHRRAAFNQMIHFLENLRS